MPMIDAFIPEGALPPDGEKQLVRKVTDLMVGHELRRIVDLMDDPADARTSYERASQVAWLFVHRTDTYVAGEVPPAPFYKFHISVPEGQADDQFRDSIVPDVTTAVAAAEGGRWPYVASRVWVVTYEVPDGSWGAGGRPNHLGRIVDFVAPGLGELAERRFAHKRRDAARATVELAESERPSV
jgi:phenylpyruvate tautomerase PptA (4-oxalocrotonate tautomerase family)